MRRGSHALGQQVLDPPRPPDSSAGRAPQISAPPTSRMKVPKISHRACFSKLALTAVRKPDLLFPAFTAQSAEENISKCPHVRVVLPGLSGLCFNAEAQAVTSSPAQAHRSHRLLVFKAQILTRCSCCVLAALWQEQMDAPTLKTCKVEEDLRPWPGETLHDFLTALLTMYATFGIPGVTFPVHQFITINSYE